MLKRIDWKYVFKCFAWLVSLGGIVTLMSFVEVKKHTVTCTNIKILIPGADNFIEREEIDAILKQSQGRLIGRSLEGINLHAIEEKIKSNPYIALSKVYADMDGVIHIEISQRQPLLRVINAGGQDYYIDRNGLKMPVSPNFTANVVVANGHILEHFSGKVDTLITKMASDLYKTALFLKKDTLWDAQIEQIFVDDKDDIELVPRVGNQRIILGTADSLETKMTNLLAFYKKAMPQVGWDTYKTISVKYSNQIVCERNKPDSLHTAFGYSAAVRPTPVTARKVMDSLVKAEIASALKNNPEEENYVATPEKKISRPVVPVVRAPVVKKVVAPAAKKSVGPTVKKPVQPTVKAVVKSAEKKVIKETKTTVVKTAEKPKETKTTTVVKTEVKKTEKPAITKKTEDKKTVKPVAKVVKKASMPEIRWIKPAATVAKPHDKKDTKKNK